MEDAGSCVINIDLNRFNNFFDSSDLYCAYRCLSYEEIANSVKSIVYHFFIGQVVNPIIEMKNETQEWDALK